MGRKDNKPRGRMTAYAYFVQACREEHDKKNPNEKIVFAEFSKKCAGHWKTMTDKEKRGFHDLADKDKIRFDKEIANFIPLDGSVVGKKRKRKETGAPKRAVTAFFYFCQDERPKVRSLFPSSTVGDISKELGKRWREVPDDSKGKYDTLAAKDKQRYEREAKAFKDAKQNLGMLGIAKPQKKLKKEESEEEEQEDEEEEQDEEEEEDDDEDD